MRKLLGRIGCAVAFAFSAGSAHAGECWTVGRTKDYVYRALGVRMLEATTLTDQATGKRRSADMAGVLAIAPPSAGASPWMRRFGASDKYETAFVSGWMQVRGIRRRRGYDRGFVLSDHADWPALLLTIKETGAKRILCTHGNSEPLVRFLRERGGEFLAIYHSHPRWAAIPSRTDLATNYYGDLPRIIVSLLAEPPDVRAWRLTPYDYAELPWRTVPAAGVERPGEPG